MIFFKDKGQGDEKKYVGVIRNRTNLFKSYRQTLIRPKNIYPDHTGTLEQDDLQKSLLSSNNDVLIEMERLPPAWHDVPKRR